MPIVMRSGNEPLPDQEFASLAGGGESAESVSAAAVARVRRLMLISALTTAIAIAAVLGAVGYRVYHTADLGGAPSEIDGTIVLPQGARVISTTVGAGEIVVTLEINGSAEIRIYDRKSLRPAGRFRFGVEPPAANAR